MIRRSIEEIHTQNIVEIICNSVDEYRIMLEDQLHYMPVLMALERVRHAVTEEAIKQLGIPRHVETKTKKTD